MLVVGGILVTIGGYLAKDGWEEMKKPAGDSQEQIAEQNQSDPAKEKNVIYTVDIDKLYSLVKEDLELRNSYVNRTTTPSAVLDYFVSISKEADALAAIWNDIADDLERGSFDKEQFIDDYVNGQLEIKYGFQNEPNAPIFSRLINFYRYLPKVTEGSVDPSWVRELTGALDRVFLERSNLLDVFSKLADRESAEAFFNSANLKKDLRNLRSSVTVLEKEAAAISALSQALRTSAEVRSLQK